MNEMPVGPLTAEVEQHPQIDRAIVRYLFGGKDHARLAVDTEDLLPRGALYCWHCPGGDVFLRLVPDGDGITIVTYFQQTFIKDEIPA